MVCDRCVAVVKNTLAELGFTDIAVELGEADLKQAVAPHEKEKIAMALSAHGFELIDDRKSQVIEKIKNSLIDQIHHSEERLKVNYSSLLSGKLNKDYSYLSNLFSEVEGITIEQFIILQKIEKVKELLVYGELTLSQIADKLGYSSVAHLSGQFKKVTGLTPSHFKLVKENKRVSIDKLKP